MTETIEELISHLESHNQQMQAVMIQKQSLMIQSKEVEKAIEELDKNKSEEVYRSVGPILVKATKSIVKKELEDYRKKQAAVTTKEEFKKLFEEKKKQQEEELKKRQEELKKLLKRTRPIKIGPEIKYILLYPSIIHVPIDITPSLHDNYKDMVIPKTMI